MGLIKTLKEMYYDMKNGEKPDFAFLIIGLSGVLIFILPILLTQTPFSKSSPIDFTETGQIGDTIGGITSPLISLLGAVITFLAFWIQIKANKVQTEQFDKQDKSNKRERFETKFYDLLKIHRDNVAEFNIEDKVRSRKCFIQMMSELRFVYCLFYKLHEAEIKKNPSIKLSPERVFNIAYLTFFYGIGKLSNNTYLELFKEVNFNLITEFHKLLEGWKSSTPKDKRTIPHCKEGICELKIQYLPFGGHASRLGHYYRNLFQIMKLILIQDDKLVNDKNEYIKILRAQLSTHEQLLLYYNIQSILGSPWLSIKDSMGVRRNAVTEFLILKNMPVQYADFYKSPREVFGTHRENDKYLFEWDEIARRFDKLEH